jgi:hypothetical protein
LTFSMSVDVAQPKLGIVGSKWKNRPKKYAAIQLLSTCREKVVMASNTCLIKTNCFRVITSGVTR